jgi:hypothetical protein
MYLRANLEALLMSAGEVRNYDQPFHLLRLGLCRHGAALGESDGCGEAE